MARRYRAHLPFALVFLVGLSAAVSGQEPIVESDAALLPPAAEPSHPPPIGDGRRTISRLPANLGRAVVGLFNQDNVTPLLVGGFATGVAAPFDNDVRNALADADAGFGQTVEDVAGPYNAVFVVGMFAAGRVAHGARFRAMTYDTLDAFVVNASLTQLMKVSFARPRPGHGNNQSFPSGHTSSAFALAAVAERHYGWKIGVPAYALAAVVGYSRIVHDQHYLADVVAGAAVGYIVGRTVVRVNSRALAHPEGTKATTWNLSPLIGPGTCGFMMTVSL